MISYGSVCSGIEAASVAWEPLGFRPSWFSQFDPEHNYSRGPDFPSAVLAHHWPHVPNLGDMTLIAEAVRYGFIEAPDVLVGGTPCQAFSVAGLRGSLSDGRGFLTLKFVELADEIDRQRPGNECVIVWENVPGVLSSKDNAFGCFLAGLAGESEPLVAPGGKWSNAGYVSGPSRAVAWRTLDAQYFGVAQRRRRVFVVASARKGFDPATVLFESEGVRRDIAPSREAGKAVAALTANGVGTCGADDNQGQAGHRIPQRWPAEIACTLNAAFGQKLGLENQHVNGGCPLFVPVQCVTGDVTHTLKAEGFDGSEDGTGRGQPIVTAFSAKDYGADATVELSPTLRAGNSHTANPNSGNWMAVAFAENSRAEVRLENGDGQITGCLSTGGGKPGQGCPTVAYGIPGNWIGRAPENGGNATEPMHDVAPCQTVADRHGVAYGMQVRRLTPVECERLQGFPDGHTLLPGRSADGPRYKALGNSMAVPVMQWIGKRILGALR